MRKLVGWGAAALVVIAAVVGALGAALGWDWGDVPTWVQSAATVAALGAAGIGAYFAYEQLGILRDQVGQQREQMRQQDEALKLQMEQLRADRREADRRAEQELKLLKAAARQQAERVAVRPNQRSGSLDNAPYHGMLAVRIDNDSSRPIRNVTARLDMKPYSRMPYGELDPNNTTGTARIRRSPLPPVTPIRGGESIELIFPVQHLSSSKEDKTYTLWTLRQDGRIADETHPGDRMSNPAIGFVVRFTDDAVQHWELDDDMHLKQLDDRSDW